MSASGDPLPVPPVLQRRELAVNPYFRLLEDRIGLGVDGEHRYYHMDCVHDAVLIVPVLDDGRLVLERIYRHPVGRYVVEFPAGGLLPGEDICAAAGRELLEETGYRAAALRRLALIEPLPGLVRLRLHIVLAEDLDRCAPPVLEPMELLATEVVERERAWELAHEDGASAFLGLGLGYLYAAGL